MEAPEIQESEALERLSERYRPVAAYLQLNDLDDELRRVGRELPPGALTAALLEFLLDEKTEAGEQLPLFETRMRLHAANDPYKRRVLASYYRLLGVSERQLVLGADLGASGLLDRFRRLIGLPQPEHRIWPYRELSPADNPVSRIELQVRFEASREKREAARAKVRQAQRRLRAIRAEASPRQAHVSAAS
jgi:hypothetical protein